MSRQDILRVVRHIPKRRVFTYGEVAPLAGMSGQAIQVGYALAGLSDPSLPGERGMNG